MESGLVQKLYLDQYPLAACTLLSRPVVHSLYVIKETWLCPFWLVTTPWLCFALGLAGLVACLYYCSVKALLIWPLHRDPVQVIMTWSHVGMAWSQAVRWAYLCFAASSRSRVSGNVARASRGRVGTNWVPSPVWVVPWVSCPTGGSGALW